MPLSSLTGQRRTFSSRHSSTTVIPQPKILLAAGWAVARSPLSPASPLTPAVCAARLTNNVLSTAQQVYLKQGGGAKAGLKDLSAEGFIDPGKARRTTVQDLSPPPRAAGAVIDTQATERPSAGELFRQRKEEEDAKKAERRRVAEAAQQKKDAEVAARKEEAEKRAVEAAQVRRTPWREARGAGGEQSLDESDLGSGGGQEGPSSSGSGQDGRPSHS